VARRRPHSDNLDRHVLFESIAGARRFFFLFVGGRALLTGRVRRSVLASSRSRRLGGTTTRRIQATSVIYGMPRGGRIARGTVAPYHSHGDIGLRILRITERCDGRSWSSRQLSGADDLVEALEAAN